MNQQAEPIVKSDILVVDDTLANLKLLSDLLTRQDLKVRSVTSGAMALSAIEAVVSQIFDIKMPEMDGYEVCIRLKSMDKTRNIPEKQ